MHFPGVVPLLVQLRVPGAQSAVVRQGAGHSPPRHEHSPFWQPETALQSASAVQASPGGVAGTRVITPTGTLASAVK